MNLAFSEPIHVGQVDPTIIEALHRPSPQPDQARYYYDVRPDDSNQEHQTQFDFAQQAIEPIRENLLELMPSIKKIKLAYVEVFQARAEAHSKKIAYETNVFHIDPPRRRTLEVLFSDEQPTEYAYGTLENADIPSDASSDAFQGLVMSALWKLGDEGMLEQGFTIFQTMPFEAMLIRGNTAHRTPPVNQRPHKIDRTHMVAIFEY